MSLTPILFEDIQPDFNLNWLVRDLLGVGDLSVIYGPPGSGKAQPLDELVLTPDGWEYMGNIKVGDFVVSSTGFPTRVLAVHPQASKEEWVVSFSNGSRVRACGDHLWKVYKKGAVAQVVTTKELANKPHTSYWNIPLCGAINYAPNRNPLPLDPYLLGALLGDGGMTAYAGFSGKDEEIINEVRRRLPAGHEMPQYAGHSYRIVAPRGQPNHVWTALRLLGLAGKRSEAKFIPDEYMRACPADRLLLLQGLMDTDGWGHSKHKTAIVWFANSSRRLVEQVRELVMSLGGIANQIKTKQTAGLPSHTLYFRLNDGANPFLLPRKAACVSPSRNSNLRVIGAEKTGRVVEMQCITVEAPDNLYITRDFIVTHNSFLALDLSLHIALGWSWWGREVEPGGVLYISCEGGRRVAYRIEAFRQHHKLEGKSAPFGLIPSTVNLLNPNAHLDSLIQEVDIFQQRTGAPVRLIVFDTLARTMVGGDENSSKDMSTTIANVNLFQERIGTASMLIHHTGKDVDRGQRGHSSLLGAIETSVRVTQNKATGVVTATVDKQKDGEEGDNFYYKLPPRIIGRDNKGWDVRSCIVEPVIEEQEVSAAEVAGDMEATVAGIFNRRMAIEGDGKSMPLEAFRRHIPLRGQDVVLKNPESMRKSAYRFIKKAEEQAYIAVIDNRVFPGPALGST